MNIHETFMKRCLELASKGLPSTMPNPSVGAIMVHEGEIIGEGFTSPYGGPHGEVNCIHSVKEKYKSLISKSTLYVSLEPCSHVGKTPPCADLIIDKKIPQVIIGCVDTFSEVAGKGIERLKKAGIEVITNILEKDCREMNKRFFTFHEKNRPYIFLKWAQTQDGYIAPEVTKHEAERWITGKESKQFVHQLRAMEEAILVGTNTVKMDNPSLTVREVAGKNPMRILIDRKLKLWQNKKDYKIFDEEAHTLILNEMEAFNSTTNEGIKIDFNLNLPSQVCSVLAKKEIQSLIIEGGTKTLQSFIDSNLWDEMLILEGEKEFYSGTKAPVHAQINGNKNQLGKDLLTVFKNMKA